ncbi:MAG: sugar O-acetyltransferase [Bdellovibrionia bacterium]
MSELKSELQKMLDGELYLASDAELVAMRKRARRLTRLFNQSTEDEIDQRTAILYDLFGKVGPRVVIEPPFYCDYGSHIFAGNDLFMNFGCVILDCAEVHFGESVMCGPNVQIYTATHPLDADLRASGPELAKPIRIGNRVWIGGSSVLCPGVTIGDNTVIGAGSVVTKDIPANVFAAGNPCRVIRDL